MFFFYMSLKTLLTHVYACRSDCLTLRLSRGVFRRVLSGKMLIKLDDLFEEITFSSSSSCFGLTSGFSITRTLRWILFSFFFENTMNRLGSIHSAANHQPVLSTIAQHGLFDDGTLFVLLCDLTRQLLQGRALCASLFNTSSVQGLFINRLTAFSTGGTLSFPPIWQSSTSLPNEWTFIYWFWIGC